MHHEREAMRWLQLTYRVPSEPSQKRVWVWRRLQNLGAYALQNSVYLLPFSEEVEKHFRVHNTGNDPLHRTVELPKPVTQEVADLFNRLFGRI